MKTKIYKYLSFFSGIILMFSCRVHRELQKDIHKDKLLLNKTSIKLNKYAKNENIIVSEYSLGEYIKQKPNRKFILNRWMPYSGIYLRAKDLYVKPQFEARINKSKTKVNAKFDKKIIAAGEDSLKAYKIRTKQTKKIKTLDDKLKLGNSVMQSINQELVWVNDTLTENSLNQIELFLESNGFFHANVEIEKKYKRDKRAQNIKYVISENRPHEVVNINYDIQDPNILKILKESINKSELKTGENYSVQKISNERERIYNLMKNNGYFDFHRQYINFRVDTTINDFEAYIDLEIKNAPGGKFHTQYILEKINVYIDIEDDDMITDTLIRNGINYFHNNTRRYSKKVLDEEIALNIGDLYNQDKSRFTKNNLGSLDIVKFVNLNFAKSDSSKLSAIINIKTQKKYQMNTEFGGNINVSSAQAIPGPYINFKLRDRLIFPGFESLEFNAIYGIQGQVNIAEPDLIYRSREMGSGLTLIFPRLIIPNFIKEANFLQRQNPFKNNIYKQTKLNISYNDIRRDEFDRTNFNLSFKYEWRKGTNERFNFSPMEIIFVNTKNITQTFSDYLNYLAQNNGINFKQSFQSSIITNLTFGYTWNNIDMTKNKKAGMIKFNGEVGGLLANLIDNLSNNNEKLFNLPFTKYYKISTDLRKYIPLTKYSNVVFRTAAGFEQNILGSNVLPYEKYFYTGGVSSNRAWQARRLGPGNYNPTDGSKNFQRPGEILFEANIEYRTKISGMFNTAFFVDASNVWSNTPNDSRENSNFDLTTVHKSIGIGAGTGVRLDFSLLIARFDFAWKVYNPALQSFVPFKVKQALFNFGIGYPF